MTTIEALKNGIVDGAGSYKNVPRKAIELSRAHRTAALKALRYYSTDLEIQDEEAVNKFVTERGGEGGYEGESDRIYDLLTGLVVGQNLVTLAAYETYQRALAQFECHIDLGFTNATSQTYSRVVELIKTE